MRLSKGQSEFIALVFRGGKKRGGIVRNRRPAKPQTALGSVSTVALSSA
jgi:hypothetical protein